LEGSIPRKGEGLFYHFIGSEDQLDVLFMWSFLVTGSYYCTWSGCIPRLQGHVAARGMTLGPSRRIKQEVLLVKPRVLCGHSSCPREKQEVLRMIS
jgi:hypothetical protein